MTPHEITVEVRNDDGSTEAVTRTLWSSHYGPIIDFPGLGWTDTTALTYRDANLDNDEFIEQYLGMMRAKNLDEFIGVHERVTGVPLFNTVAVSADGRAWYADTSATHNLSDEAIAAYEASIATDPIVKVAADNRVVLLDGSDPRFEWVDEPGARDPGLVPYAEMPRVERSDYVFNANDSFWMPHATEMLEGDYSPLHGRQRTARSPRTRENATVLGDTSPSGPAGADGAFTLDELAAAALANRGFTARALRTEVVGRCRGVDAVTVPALRDGEDGSEVLPAGTVPLAEACRVLASWDGVYDLDRAGPPLWREFMARYPFAALLEAGELWAEPFDPARPVDTPGGLAPPPDGGDDPVLVNLARAVQTLQAGGIPVDATLGELQVADRNGVPVPIHGGDNRDGTTNIVGWGRSWTILDPALAALEHTPVVPDSSLARSVTADGTSSTGYPVNNGTSFLLALAYTADGPRAKAFLTYGNPADRSSPLYREATERFSAKDWRDVAFTEDQIASRVVRTTTVRG
jgi:acyl-homoserine-lactone acylase